MTLDSLREPITGKEAKLEATFRLTFNRPKFAIEVSPEARANQLRLILQEQTKITARCIKADVVIGQGRDKETFCITFRAPQDHPIAEQLVTEAINQMNPEKLKEIVSDGTGLDPRRIKTEKEEAEEKA